LPVGEGDSEGEQGVGTGMTGSRLLEDREGVPWAALETTLEQANEEGEPGWTSLAS